jgi:hypothetical protein
VREALVESDGLHPRRNGNVSSAEVAGVLPASDFQGADNRMISDLFYLSGSVGFQYRF